MFTALKIFKCLVIASCLMLLSTTGAFAHSTSSTSHKSGCSFEGVYTLSIEGFGGTTVFGNLSVQKDGTLVLMDSGDIGQPIPSTFPNGFAATTQTGTWKRIGKRSFKFFVTAVFAVKDPSNCCISTPFARSKIEGTCVLSKNCKDAAFDFEVSFWALDDLTLKTTNVAPPTPLSAVGRKVSST